MSENKFTHGPWYLDEYGHVCSKESKLWNKCIGVSGIALTGGKEAEANAKLIAAAPELLEALEGMRNFMEWRYGEEDPFVLDANKAIAKAKGEL